MSLTQRVGLYCAIQWRRNEGLGALFLVLSGFLIAYAVLFPGILSPGGLSRFAQNWFPMALVAAAQTIIMLTGGTTMVNLGIGGGIAAVLAMGAAIGGTIGWIVTVGRYPAIIVTLASSFIISGAALLILPRPGGSIPPELSDFLAGGQPVAAVMLVLLIIAWKLYQASPLGIGLVAVGSNAIGAYRSGVNTTASRILAYALSSMLQAFAGLYVAAQTGSGDPVIGQPFTLAAIAAAVLGGVSFLGGQGTMRGALAGSLLMSVLINVMFFMSLPPVAQYIVQGLIIVITAAVPRVRQMMRRVA
jgi:ribose transport system permease protein